jgi:hypothetical protein
LTGPPKRRSLGVQAEPASGRDTQKSIKCPQKGSIRTDIPHSQHALQTRSLRVVVYFRVMSTVAASGVANGNADWFRPDMRKYYQGLQEYAATDPGTWKVCARLDHAEDERPTV